MHTIDHRRFQQKAPRRQLPLTRILRTSGIVLAVFILGNLLMGLAYHNKALPGHRLGNKAVGGMSYAAIAKLQQPAVMADTVELTLTSGKTTTKKTVKVNDFGVIADMPASVQHLKQSKTWLPVLSFVIHPQVALVTKVDESRFNAATDAIAPQFEKPATDRHVGLVGSTFRVEEGQAGYLINRATFKSKLTTTIIDGKSTMTVPTTVSPAGKSTTDLSGEVTHLNKQLGTDLSFAPAPGQKIRPTATEKAQWFVPQGQLMVASDEQIGRYLDGLAAKQGISLANRSDLIIATKYALTKNQAYAYRLVATQNSRKNTYCTAVKGVSAASLDDLVGKLAATYADTRGWNNDGTMAFEHVDSGCRYTVWLSAPQYMTSFGAICDDYYNCQVGSNVIVNDDRWEKATEPWNKTGRTIEEYRSLIINHESGHRLGFLDNPTCAQAGQLAPVMMQQSISLNGCEFNPWPLPAELTAQRTM